MTRFFQSHYMFGALLLWGLLALALFGGDDVSTWCGYGSLDAV